MKSNQKVAVILQWILESYSLDGRNIDQMEFDADYMAKLADVGESALPLILDRLERKGIIKSYFESGEDFVIPKSTFVILFPNKFKDRAEEYISSMSFKKSGNNELDKIGRILYLDADGNFWHGENPSQFCYPMDGKSKRYNILKYLIENEGYQSPAVAIQHLQTKTTKTFRSEISKIRANIKKYLGIDGNDLIESRDDSGYRINPKYKIFLVKKE